MTDYQIDPDSCSVCGGRRPRDPDAWDHYLVQPHTGSCPGYLAVDERGQVVGCGAWDPAAYEEEAYQEEE